MTEFAPVEPDEEIFVAPLTGELVAGELAHLSRIVNETYEEIDRLRVAVRPLVERRAELRGPVRVPRRRDRTDIQDRAVRCPHCGRNYEEIA
jgi:hypothetical protein